MGRPDRLGNALSVHVSMPEKVYDCVQSEVKKRQRERPGASVTMSEVIRETIIRGLGCTGCHGGKQ